MKTKPNVSLDMYFAEEAIKGEEKLSYLQMLKEKYSQSTDKKVDMNNVIEVSNDFFIKNSFEGQVTNNYYKNLRNKYANAERVEELRDFISTCESNVVYETKMQDDIEFTETKAFQPIIPNCINQPSIANKIWNRTKEVAGNVANFIGSIFQTRKRFF